jgi:hypothetical protein
MQTVFIGLDSWIVQDGNYCDFRIGEETQFAVEFHPFRTSPAASQSAQMVRQNGCRYQCQARYAFIAENVCVLDFGIAAYSELRSPMDAKLNDWIDVELYLGIDPFFYSERLVDIPGMPLLSYDWRIEKIWLETTPWLETRDSSGRTVRSRDATREGFRETGATDAWNDDGGHAHYLLECRVIGGPRR